jgi:uncharacterized protein
MSPDGPGHLGIVRFAELPAVPWRNGGGVTREVVASGGSGRHGFDWRISIADVSQPGPFSMLPGVERVIIMVEGERMDLVVDGVVHVLRLHEPLSFEGASQTACSLPSGPTRDLNVMTRCDPTPSSPPPPQRISTRCRTRPLSGSSLRS